jgi:hypothetical protein
MCGNSIMHLLELGWILPVLAYDGVCNWLEFALGWEEPVVDRP